MGYQPCACSWSALGRLRRRGQKPVGLLFITDNWRQRKNLEDSGAFAVSFPLIEECIFAAGLEVVLIADPTELAMDMAQHIASARPRFFATHFRGRERSVVLR